MRHALSRLAAIETFSKWLRSALEHLPTFGLIVRGKRVLCVSAPLVQSLGYESSERLVGRPLAELVVHERTAEEEHPGLAPVYGPTVELSVLRRAGGLAVLAGHRVEVDDLDGAEVTVYLLQDRTEERIAHPLAPQGRCVGVEDAVGRGAAGRLLPTDVHRVMDSAIDQALGDHQSSVRVVRDYGQVPFVEADEAHLEQVFVNLLVNAAQAIADGVGEPAQIRITTHSDEMGYANIEVTDTGEGIRAEILPRIFEPFFTTKPTAGTGLGLSICRRIVRSFRGQISADNEVGRGARFVIRLPPAPVPASHQRMRIATTPHPPRGRVLVIDDEQSICSALKRMLGRDHDVVTLSSACEAIELLAAEDTTFDIIVCDLMMPVMTGVELYDQLAQTRPKLLERFVFLSGGAFTPRARAFLARVDNPRLEKPFDPRELQTLIAARLGAGPSNSKAESA